MDLTYIDLCCGIGGFHQALEKIGCSCVFACDIDNDCRENYELNYGISVFGDINEVVIEQIPEFNILCAGFPCQPFSKAGNQDGFNDNRGNIFFRICEIIEYHKPEYIILENVRNLTSHDKGNTWNIIHETLNKLGYNTYNKPLLLNTLYFGVPQSRERVIIVCKRNDIGDLPEYPKINKNLIQDTTLETIISETDNSHGLNSKMIVVEEVWNNFLNILNNNNIEIPRFPIWTDWWDGCGENTSITKKDKTKSDEENNIMIKNKQDKFYNKYKNWIDKNRHFYNTNIDKLESWLYESRARIEWIGAVRKFEWQVSNSNSNLTMNDVLWSSRGSGIRVKSINYTPTLVAMTSMIPVYGPLSRHLTPRECARLQSFPENYIIHPDDRIAYKQFGNAVNVLMIERCARFLLLNESLF